MRDDFDKNTRDILGRRVAFRCSNPNCRKSTVGPQKHPRKAVDLGVAAHITAASEGGPRFDPLMTSEARKSVDNGIWLCQNCAKLVDNDILRFSVTVLKGWKRDAEDDALRDLNAIGRHSSTGIEEPLGKIAAPETETVIIPVPNEPSWLRGKNINLVIAILFAGAWEPTCEGDRDALEKLSGGEDFRKVEQLCVELSNDKNSPIVRKREAWSWSSLKEAWRILAANLTETQLQEYRNVLREVLGEDHPKLELPISDRWFSNIYGKTTKFSPSLRLGIARSLVYLTLNDDHNKRKFGRSLGRYTADFIVKDVLGKPWERWASLGELLPILAEASPNSFLEALQESLSFGDKGVYNLLYQESSFGSNPHHNLFWALEGLAWNEEFLIRVVHCLAQLASKDPGGSYSNRPINSLSRILHYAMPQTSASVEARTEAIKAIANREEQIAWDLACGYLDRFGSGLMFSTHRPTILQWSLPPKDTFAPQTDIAKFAESIEGLLIQLVDQKPERWAHLVKIMSPSPSKFDEQILDNLDRNKDSIIKNDPDCLIWDALRRFLNISNRKKERKVEEEVFFHKVSALFEKYTPEDIVKRISWLFKFRVVLPEPERSDWKKENEIISKKRHEALLEVLHQKNCWEIIQDLANKVEYKGIVGAILADIPESTSLDETFLAYSIEDASSVSEMISGFISRRIGQNGLEWLDRIMLRFLLKDRPKAAVTVALAANASSELWRLLEKYDESVQKGYWKSVVQLWWCEEKEEMEYAIEKLIAVERPHIAVEVASHAMSRNKKIVSEKTAYMILQSLRDVIVKYGPDEYMKEDNQAYSLEELFKIVDRNESIPDSNIVPLETFFLPVLYHSGRPANRLFKVLERDPEFFSSLVDLMYKPESKTKDEIAQDIIYDSKKKNEESDGRAEVAYRILDIWKTYPGFGQSDDDREEKALKWAQKVLEITKSQDHEHMGETEVAKVLARMPAFVDDNCWPCRAARELIRTDSSLAQSLRIAKYNLRGMVSRKMGEGGKQESELASQFKAEAKIVERDWPETATLLIEMARTYESDAERVDMEKDRYDD